MKQILTDLNPWELRARIRGLPFERAGFGTALLRGGLLCSAGSVLTGLACSGALWVSCARMPELNVTQRLTITLGSALTTLGLLVYSHLTAYREDGQQDNDWGDREARRWFEIEQLMTLAGGPALWLVLLPELYLAFWLGGHLLQASSFVLPLLLLCSSAFLGSGGAQSWVILLALTRGHRRARDTRRGWTRRLGAQRAGASLE